jgi:hypothetical protein
MELSSRSYIFDDMVEKKKRCNNCWVWVEKDLDICPNCSHPFVTDESPLLKSVEVHDTSQEPSGKRTFPGRPFIFIIFFMLSVIVILSFMTAEGIKLKGSLDGKYILADVIEVSVLAIMIALVLTAVDYLASYGQ